MTGMNNISPQMHVYDEAGLEHKPGPHELSGVQEHKPSPHELSGVQEIYPNRLSELHG